MSLDLIVESGEYVGNGGTQSISIGWQPAMVMIVTTRTGGPAGQRAWSVKMATMPGDDFASCNATADWKTTNGITLTSDGFDVGSNPEINRNGDTIHWWAVREYPSIDWGSYVGDGAPGGVKIATNRQPTAVFIFNETTPSFITKMFTMAAPDDAEAFDGAIATQPWVELTSAGFIPKLTANTLNDLYHWVALYDLPGSTRHFRQGEHTGDVNPAQQVVLGVQPRMVIVSDTGMTLGAKFRASLPTEYGQLQTNYKWVTSGGITLNAAGFLAGGDFNADTVVYDHLAGVQ